MDDDFIHSKGKICNMTINFYPTHDNINQTHVGTIQRTRTKNTQPNSKSGQLYNERCMVDWILGNQPFYQPQKMTTTATPPPFSQLLLLPEMTLNHRYLKELPVLPPTVPCKCVVANQFSYIGCR
jgi:hypothetical protein